MRLDLATRRSRCVACLVPGAGFVIAAVVALAGCGAPTAPATGAIPLAPGLRVVASAAGGSNIDPASDHRQYRYMVLAGPKGIRVGDLARTEIQFLIAHGWKHAQAYRIVDDASTGTSRMRTVAVGSPGSAVEVDSPNQQVYAAIEMITDLSDAAQKTDGDPLHGNPVITQAIRHDEPTLDVLLGNGKHGPASNGTLVGTGG